MTEEIINCHPECGPVISRDGLKRAGERLPSYTHAHDNNGDWCWHDDATGEERLAICKCDCGCEPDWPKGSDPGENWHDEPRCVCRSIQCKCIKEEE